MRGSSVTTASRISLHVTSVSGDTLARQRLLPDMAAAPAPLFCHCRPSVVHHVGPPPLHVGPSTEPDKIAMMTQ